MECHAPFNNYWSDEIGKGDKYAKPPPISSGLTQQMHSRVTKESTEWTRGSMHRLDMAGQSCADGEGAHKACEVSGKRSASKQLHGGSPLWSHWLRASATSLDLPAMRLTSTSTVEDEIRIESLSKNNASSIWALKSLWFSCRILGKSRNSECHSTTWEVSDHNEHQGNLRKSFKTWNIFLKIILHRDLKLSEVWRIQTQGLVEKATKPPMPHDCPCANSSAMQRPSQRVLGHILFCQDMDSACIHVL